MQQPSRAGEVREWQSNVALAVIGGLVHGNQQDLAHVAGPGEDQEAVVRPVALPARRAFKQLPIPVADDRITKHGEQAFLENRGVAIPQDQSETESLMVIGDACKTVFTPAIGTRTGLVVCEIVPGISPFAVDFANCASLSLT
jgi:hypothetical protein